MLYTLPMVAAAIAPWALGLTGWVYGVASILLNASFLVLALAVLANKADEPKRMGPEKRLFAFSILYLFVLFAALVVDRWVIADAQPDDEFGRRIPARRVDPQAPARTFASAGDPAGAVRGADVRHHHRQDDA